MHTAHTLGHVPGNRLIRALAGAALAASAIAAGTLVSALAAPGTAHAEVLTPGYSLTAAPAPRFGPGTANRLAGTSAAQPAWGAVLAPTAAIPRFRVESDFGAVTTIYHMPGYDLRLGYGTVFYRAARLPGQSSQAFTARGRVMSSLITRF